MTTETLALISEKLNDAGIPYEFGLWSSTPVPSTYFVGEFTDVAPVNEDGMQESTFMLTGTTNGKWLELMDAKETIERLFPDVGFVYMNNADNIAAVIAWSNSMIIPTNAMDIKRIQINLQIKEWKVN